MNGVDRSTKTVMIAIGALVLAFNAVAFYMDAHRPNYALRAPSAFPEDALPSPLPPVPSSPSPTAPEAGIISPTDAVSKPDGVPPPAGTAAPVTATIPPEDRLTACARAIEAGDPAILRHIEDPGTRDSLLNASRKIDRFREVSPAGALPGYLETELRDIGVREAVERVPDRDLVPWTIGVRSR